MKNAKQRTAHGGEDQPLTKKHKSGSSPRKSPRSPAKSPKKSPKLNEKLLASYPDDWPALEGEIDLNVHDLPHESSSTEWWYLNCHVQTESGKPLSAFASFFRSSDREGAYRRKERGEEEKTSHAHSLTWAIIDPAEKKYYADPIVDKNAPYIFAKALDEKEYQVDPRIEKALREVLAKDRIPGPDRIFDADIVVAENTLDLDYGGNTLVKDAHGNYLMSATNPNTGCSFDLKFVPKKKPIRQGTNGIVAIGRHQEDMFYYFIPRCDVTGTVTIQGKTEKVHGNGWYDHEFGGVSYLYRLKKGEQIPEKKVSEPAEKKKSVNDYAWNWLSAQLDDGTDLTATILINPEDNKVIENYAILVGPDSTRTYHSDMVWEASDEWTSTKTIKNYPTHWKLRVPSANLELDLKAAFKHQEFMTLISKSSFWEGRMNVTGTYKGKHVKGPGFVERSGFDAIGSLDVFFKRVSNKVRGLIADLLPMNPNYTTVRDLMANKDFEHFMDGVDTEVFGKTMIQPLREIVDRGGKSWRSFALVLCIDAVGGDSTPYENWLAMPEIMHAGSLIVDDIQDESETRRGGKTAHEIYGTPIAINAGTAAYFLGLHILMTKSPVKTLELKLRFYEYYILCLRAAHAGQAFDIYGLNHKVEQYINEGRAKELERSVVCTHRLKSAAPAGLLARMGALAGDAAPEVVEKIGLYFESIGIAFQIIDDVLNLRGFKGNGKTRGEDLAQGKMTHPVSLAMAMLPKEKALKVWNEIASKPQDQREIERLIDILEDVGAIEASVTQARDIVNNAWKELDDTIPDNFSKLLLRAFGMYVLDRHY